MKEKVEEVINNLRPYLNSEGGNIELIKIELLTYGEGEQIQYYINKKIIPNTNKQIMKEIDYCFQKYNLKHMGIVSNIKKYIL